MTFFLFYSSAAGPLLLGLFSILTVVFEELVEEGFFEVVFQVTKRDGQVQWEDQPQRGARYRRRSAGKSRNTAPLLTADPGGRKTAVLQSS